MDQLVSMFEKEKSEIELMINDVLTKKKSKKLLPKDYRYNKEKKEKQPLSFR